MLDIKRKIKKKGQVYTPAYIVKNILDMAGYNKNNILKKHIIDNSAGDGIFLVNIVDRYILEYKRINGCLDKKLEKELEKYIHGIELQTSEFNQCIENLNEVSNRYNLNSIDWDIQNADSLFVDVYNKKMDFVVGNPPYVRVHNLEKSYNKVKEYTFSQNGMTDLYIVFFEIGLNMLKDNGKMCIISPSSYLHSVAGITLRKYIQENKYLIEIVDLEHFQPFEKITNYTVISLFQKKRGNKTLKYYKYNSDKKNKTDLIKLKYEDVFIDGNIFLSDKENLKKLRKIFLQKNDISIEVKNGFATLSDGVFIKDNFPFDDLIIDIKKASTGKYYKCIFPYDTFGIPLLEKEIKDNYKNAYKYFLDNKEMLLDRSIKDKKNQWHLFGRSQALKDISKSKIAINTIIKDIDSIKMKKEKKGVGIYSGLYIMTKRSFKNIEGVIKNKDFILYVRSLKKYKSGGYYTFSSKDLKRYLDYKLTQ